MTTQVELTVDAVTGLAPADLAGQREQGRVRTQARTKQVVVREGLAVGLLEEAQRERPLERAADIAALETVTTSHAKAVQQKAELLPRTIGVSTGLTDCGRRDLPATSFNMHWLLSLLPCYSFCLTL